MSPSGDVNKRMTAKEVQSLQSREKRYEVWDPGNVGFGIRVYPSGVKSWVYFYSCNGRRRRMMLGNYPDKSLAVARNDYDKARKLVAGGIDPLDDRLRHKQERITHPSISQLSTRYLEHYVRPKLKPATSAKYERQLKKHVLPKLGKRKVKEVRKAEIVSLVEEMASKTPILANRVLALVKGLFSYAVSVDIIQLNPASGIQPPGKEHIRERVLNLSEIAALWKLLDQHHNQDHADAIKLILLTAQRPGEVVDIHGDDIEGCWWKLAGSKTKSGRPNRIYLAPLAREIINGRQGNSYLFPTAGENGRLRRDTLKASLVKLMPELKEKGVGYFTLHDLRRSAATGIAALGYGAIVPDILNHSVTGITRLVYDQYSRDPEKQMALEAWDKQLQKVISCEGDNVNVISLPT